MASDPKVARLEEAEVEGTVRDFGAFKFERLLSENPERWGWGGKTSTKRNECAFYTARKKENFHDC
jgi:hypothetical protein